jgi:hypothetical protein
LDNLLDKSLCYEQSLPLAIRQLAEKPDHYHLESSGLHNEGILRSLASMESLAVDSEEGDEIRQEIQRLESKLDLALDMLMQLVSAAHPPPDEVAVRLNEYALQWQGGPEVTEGQWLEISLFLNPRFPQPLLLPGIVAGTDPNVVHFEALTENFRDLLSRYIFRQHRRLVARQRGGG